MKPFRSGADPFSQVPARTHHLPHSGAPPYCAQGWTPLHDAVYANHTGAAKRLVQHGADLNTKNVVRPLMCIFHTRGAKLPLSPAHPWLIAGWTHPYR